MLGGFASEMEGRRAAAQTAEGSAAVQSSLGKRPSSEAGLEDAPGREERLRLVRLNEDARKHYERQRDQAQKERDQAQKQCVVMQKERDQAQHELELAQKKCSELQEQCSEAQRKSDFFLREAQDTFRWLREASYKWRKMSGRDIDDLPEEKLEQLAVQIEDAKERVEKMRKRRTAEARVLAKHPDYTCPISLVIMRDPVVTADGQSYERTEIEAWFETLREKNEPLTSPLRAPPGLVGRLVRIEAVVTVVHAVVQ
jgi:hypothetical protein